MSLVKIGLWIFVYLGGQAGASFYSTSVYRQGYSSSVQQQYKQLIMFTVLYSLAQARFDNQIISIQNNGEECQTHHCQHQSTNIGDKF